MSPFGEISQELANVRFLLQLRCGWCVGRRSSVDLYVISVRAVFVFLFVEILGICIGGRRVQLVL